jgi:hypothetical protein
MRSFIQGADGKCSGNKCRIVFILVEYIGLQHTKGNLRIVASLDVETAHDQFGY